MRHLYRALHFLIDVYRWFIAWFVGDRAYRLAFVSEEPPRLDRRTVYAIGENGHLWHVTFLCPCGCSSPISINLLPDDSPRWRLTENNRIPTLSPSVQRQVGCRSHFFLRNGTVEWVEGTESRLIS